MKLKNFLRAKLPVCDFTPNNGESAICLVLYDFDIKKPGSPAVALQQSSDAALGDSRVFEATLLTRSLYLLEFFLNSVTEALEHCLLFLFACRAATKDERLICAIG